MALSRWVVNASPLILLGKTGQIGLLSALSRQIAIPLAVAEEIGTLGLVGRAKVMGLIDRAAPLVRRLRESGLYASDEMIERLLREVGE